jgi:hypothetical protein
MCLVTAILNDLLEDPNHLLSAVITIFSDPLSLNLVSNAPGYFHAAVGIERIQHQQ